MEAFRPAEFKDRATDRQSCLQARKEGMREQDRAIISPSIADGGTITERLCLKGSRKEMKRAPWREKEGGGETWCCIHCDSGKREIAAWAEEKDAYRHTSVSHRILLRCAGSQ